MAQERIGNLGYLAFKKETTKGVPVKTDTYVPFYSSSLVTNANHVEANPAFGSRFEVYQQLQGQRSHSGNFVVMAEPNTAAYFFDMTLTRTNTTGTSPATHTFGLSNTIDPSSYTIDESFGNIVVRWWGFQASEIAPEWNDNEMRLNVTGSALGSFAGRKIATVSGATVTFSTDYDPNPTKGLVVGDLVRVFKTNETTEDFTVSAVTNATTITLSGSTTGAAGDFLYLRPATPSFTLLSPFLWAKTEFRYGSTAAEALTAAHTPLETGAGWSITNGFEDEAGAKRSGSFDPASLPRVAGRYTFTDRRFFDTPEQVRQFNGMEKVAIVARHFSGANNEYELRVTMNHMKVGNPVPPIEVGSVIYSEQALLPQYDGTDGQGFDVKVINNISSI